MADDKTFLEKLRKDKQAEAEAALSVDEQKRLVRLGIDPAGDPVDIMMQVEARLRALAEEN